VPGPLDAGPVRRHLEQVSTNAGFGTHPGSSSSESKVDPS
jgi:hypothetical protein